LQVSATIPMERTICYGVMKENMRIEMYSLCLFRFKDDKVVFTEGELESISTAIRDSSSGLKFLTKKMGWYVYKVNIPYLENLCGEGPFNATIVSAELGYYHHRAIVKYELELRGGYGEVRETRRKLKKVADLLINDTVVKRINDLVSSNAVRQLGTVTYFYTYPLIVIKDGMEEKEEFPFSDQTGTLAFEITEPSWIFPHGKSHIVRISIPGTTLFVQGDIDKNLLRDMTNAIYQYCLYEKKLKDIREETFENIIDESLLVNLWKYVLNTMGGRTIDIYNARIAHRRYFIALLAFGVGVVALLLSLR
jgi:hypothetical protein